MVVGHAQIVAVGRHIESPVPAVGLQNMTDRRASHQRVPWPVLDEGVVEVGECAIAGMGDFGMVGLDEIIDHHFPVGVDLVVDVACLDEIRRRHAAGAGIREDRAQGLLGRWRRAVDVDEDERIDFGGSHRQESDGGPVERLEMRRAPGADEAPVEIVDPAVVGTLQHVAAVGPAHHLHGAVLTDIVKHVERTVAVAHGDKRLAVERAGQHAARFRHFAGMAHVEP